MHSACVTAFVLALMAGPSLAYRADTAQNPFVTDAERQTHERYVRIESRVPPVKNSLDTREISALYEATINNPVARIDRVEEYDKDGTIGFCFGRAAAAYLGARSLGLSEVSVRKLFIVGALCAGCQAPTDPPEWRFHVTTIVKGRDGDWYAIDPIMYNGGAYHPLTVAQWIARVREGWDTYHGGEPKARLYLTSGKAIVPDLRTLPSPESGEHIIELNFVPDAHGILADEAVKSELRVTTARETIHVLDSVQEQKYFLATNATEPDRFLFSGLLINGTDAISFNNYFSDLVETNLTPTVQAEVMAMLRTARETVRQAWPEASKVSEVPDPRQWIGGWRPQR